MDRDRFLVLMEARSLLRSEGFHPRNDRRYGISLTAAIEYAVALLRCGGRITEHERTYEESFDLIEPSDLREALALIDEAAHQALSRKQPH